MREGEERGGKSCEASSIREEEASSPKGRDGGGRKEAKLKTLAEQKNLAPEICLHRGFLGKRSMFHQINFFVSSLYDLFDIYA